MAGIASAIMSEMMMTVEGGDHAENLSVRDRSKMSDWRPELQKFRWVEEVVEGKEEEKLMYFEDKKPKKYPSVTKRVNNLVDETSEKILNILFERTMEKDPVTMQDDVFRVNNLDLNHEDVKMHEKQLERRTRALATGQGEGLLLEENDEESRNNKKKTSWEGMPGRQLESPSARLPEEMDEEGIRDQEKPDEGKAGREKESQSGKAGKKSASRKRVPDEEGKMPESPPAPAKKPRTGTPPPVVTLGGRKVKTPDTYKPS